MPASGSRYFYKMGYETPCWIVLASHLEPTIGELQNAIKELRSGNLDVEKIKAEDVEIYATGTDIQSLADAERLPSDTKLPSDTSERNPLVVYVPHKRQNIPKAHRIIQGRS